LNAAQVLGRTVPGWIADRWGRFNTMVLSSLPCAVVILVLWLRADSTDSIVAFAVLFGLLSGTAHSLTPVCISQLCATEEYASKYGTAYLFVSSATLIGIPISGAILGEKQDFSRLIWFCGAFYLASAALFGVARVAGAGWKVRKIY